MYYYLYCIYMLLDMLGTTLKETIKMQELLLNEFYATHYQRPSESVHNGITWVSRVTDSPCGLNPCEVCTERNELGLSQPPKDINPI